MTVSVGQTFAATGVGRAGTEPGKDDEAKAGGGFADLLSGKMKAGADAKKAAQTGHGVADDPPETGQADDSALSSIVRATGKKAAAKADERNAKNALSEEQSQPPRDKLPELISLQQLGALPAQSNQVAQAEKAKPGAGAAKDVAHLASAAGAPLEKQPVSTDPGVSAPVRDVSDQGSKSEPFLSLASDPSEKIIAEATGETTPGNGKQGLTILLDDDASPAKAAPEPRNAAEKHAASGDFTIKSQQSFPAPITQPLGSTSAALVNALDSGLRQASATLPALLLPGSTVAVPAHILKIELHPAELGSVVASLRLTGQQLSVEIKPETHEAHRRLSTDTETLARSLRSLGFDIESVTVLQPSIATPAAARADGPALMNQTGRDQPSFQPGGSDGRGDGQTGQQSGRNRNHDAQEAVRSAPAVRERGGGGLFI